MFLFSLCYVIRQGSCFFAAPWQETPLVCFPQTGVYKCRKQRRELKDGFRIFWWKRMTAENNRSSGILVLTCCKWNYCQSSWFYIKSRLCLFFFSYFYSTLWFISASSVTTENSRLTVHLVIWQKRRMMKSGGRAHSLQLLSSCSSPLSSLPFVKSSLSWKTLVTTISLSFISDWFGLFDLKALETVRKTNIQYKHCRCLFSCFLVQPL